MLVKKIITNLKLCNKNGYKVGWNTIMMVALKLVYGEKKKKTLEGEIGQAKRNVDIFAVSVDSIFQAVESQDKNLNPHLVEVKKTSYPLKEISEVIGDFYLSDSGEYGEEEFDLVLQAISFELAKYYRHREFEHNLTSKTIFGIDQAAQMIYGSLQNLYPNVNDFIFEYEKFREWHSVEGDDLKSKSFSFWMDNIFYHGVCLACYDIFKKAQIELIEASKGKSFRERRELREKINKELGF